MAERFSPAQILKDLRAGPTKTPPPTAHQVNVAASKYPPQFAGAIHALFYGMSDAVMRYPRRDAISPWVKFVRAWRGTLDTDEARFFLGSLDAYQRAVAAGLRDLDWASADTAPAVARSIATKAPHGETVEGLAWRVLLGQVQSIYSRDEAAETFREVREHPRALLVKDFFRDTGALTYYSEAEVAGRRRDVPTLAEMRHCGFSPEANSEQALLISMDPNFFRIYAPMILHTAQQLPTVDFVILLCAAPEAAETLREDTEKYLAGLAALNRQDAPRNVRAVVVNTPDWVADERTFFACARFLALPDLLEEYQSVYAIDADMFIIKDPRPFLKKTATLTLGVTRTEGSLGVPPWRRYMAGNVVANRDYVGTPMMERFHDYLSVGLSEPTSWMLDQNALAYAVEAVAGYKPLTIPRPTVVGSFMGQWERNYGSRMVN